MFEAMKSVLSAFLTRFKSRARLEAEVQVQDLIGEISLVNPLWGAPRIHGELLKLGIGGAPSTVATYMVNQRRPPSHIKKR